MENQQNIDRNEESSELVANDQVSNELAATDQPSKKIFGKRAKIALVAIVVVLGGVTAVLGSRIWDPLWNPFRPEPETVISKALTKTRETETARFKININMGVQAEGENVNIGVGISGVGDNRDALNPKFQSEFKLSITEQGVEMFSAGEARAIGEVLYFKVDTIPLPITSFLMMMNVDLEQWRGKWISVDPKDTGMSFTPNTEEQKELERKVLEMLKNYPVLQVTNELPDKTINGVKVYHYLLSFNRENTESFLMKLINDERKRRDPGYEGPSEQEIEEMKKFINLFKDIKIEIYIGKKDYLIYQITGSGIIDLPDELSEVTGKINLAFDINFSDFNQPMEISVPEEVTSILDFLKFFMTNTDDPFGLQGAQNRATDARVIAALSQVRAIAEIFHSRDGDYNNLCLNNSRLNTLEVDVGLNTLQEEIDDNTEGQLACYTRGNNYCISVKLNDGNFWCVNSAGESTRTITGCRSATTRCLD